MNQGSARVPELSHTKEESPFRFPWEKDYGEKANENFNVDDPFAEPPLSRRYDTYPK